MSDIYKSLYAWSESEEIKDLQVTIQTILDLEPNEVLKCLCFDRNFGEYLEDQDPFEGSNLKASEILEDAYYLRFTKGLEKDSIEGKFFIACGLEEIDTEDDDNNEGWLHVEYRPDCWYPFQNGIFEVMDPQLKSFGHERRLAPGSDRNWTEFPKNTRLGWRGPMIPISKMDQVPINLIRVTTGSNEDS
jgi:hypothetical protein